jgi:hypothetical protein
VLVSRIRKMIDFWLLTNFLRFEKISPQALDGADFSDEIFKCQFNR